MLFGCFETTHKHHLLPSEAGLRAGGVDEVVDQVQEEGGKVDQSANVSCSDVVDLSFIVWVCVTFIVEHALLLPLLSSYYASFSITVKLWFRLSL